MVEEEEVVIFMVEGLAVGSDQGTCIVKIDIEMMGVRVTGLETEAGRQEEIITNETRAQTGVVHHTLQEGIGAVLQEGRGRRRKRGIIGREVITRMGQRGPTKVME